MEAVVVNSYNQMFYTQRETNVIGEKPSLGVCFI